MVIGSPSQHLIPADWQSKPLSPSFVSNLAKDGIQLGTPTSSAAVSAKMPKNQLRAARRCRLRDCATRSCCAPATGCSTARSRIAAATRASATTTRSSSRSSTTRRTTPLPNRLPDGSLVGLDARSRVVLDPVNVNANGLTLRGVEFDYQTPRYPQLQRDAAGRAVPEPFGGDRVRRHARTTPRDVHRHEQRAAFCCRPGPIPQPFVQFPDFARGSLNIRTVGVSSYDSLQTKFQRRYHGGLQFLVSYTLSDSKTNAGDSLSGGGVGGLRAPDVAGWDLANDIGLSGFHTKHAFVFSGSYDLPGRDRFSSGWRTNWVLSLYSGQAQTINCSVASGSGTGCYALVVGDPYAGTTT